MIDITVQQVIATFKGVTRRNLVSTAETDDFLDILKLKTHWTLEEYKEFSLAYALENMNASIIDFLNISHIKRKYKFILNWEDYFHVLDNVQDKRKQKKYINYYFWYYHQEMNESFYLQLIEKPYFKYLGKESKLKFLNYSIKTDNSNVWINKYFTQKELSEGLKKNSFYIFLQYEENTIIENEINDIKVFYNQYEHLLNNKSKLKFFLQVIQSGSIELIKFLYEEKKVINIKILPLIWAVCADTAAHNTTELLNCLKEIGIKFTQNDLKKCEKHNNWGYMERKEELLYFFKMIESETKYNKLTLKLKSKNFHNKNKINKI